MNKPSAKTTWHQVFDPRPYSSIPDRITGEAMFGEYDTIEDSFRALDAVRKFYVKNGGYPYDITIIAREHGIFRRMKREPEGMAFQKWLLGHGTALKNAHKRKRNTWHISIGPERPSRVPKKPNPDNLFADYITLEDALGGNDAIRQFVEQTSKRKHRSMIIARENGVLRYIQKDELRES